MSSRSSLQVVEAGVDREVLVHLGQLLELDLLDGDLERRLAPGELLVAVVGGERQLDRARLAGARAEQALLEAGIRLPAPSSTSWSRPSPPANGSNVVSPDASSTLGKRPT